MCEVHQNDFRCYVMTSYIFDHPEEIHGPRVKSLMYSDRHLDAGFFFILSAERYGVYTRTPSALG